ncbi:hypothetical protein ETB97_003782 [Aspergillus alliaceus]|uniref:Uncharacterized protein n=1 Tax=Petromyces alliaceus TaxID=209559 RepID=A0A8H6E594_PETAA|nr:hypothetical protein ETB97_003782 [Aspergillus burnettii]
MEHIMEPSVLFNSTLTTRAVTASAQWIMTGFRTSGDLIEHDVVTLTINDPISATSTKGIQGQGQNKTHCDAFKAPTQKELCINGSLYSQADYVSDGLVRRVQRWDNAGNTTQYTYDGYNRVSQTAWPDGHITKVEYAPQSSSVLPVSFTAGDHNIGEQSFDGLERMTRRIVGERITTQTYTYTETALKRSKITNPKQDRYQLAYQAALNLVLTSLTTGDDNTSYQYNSQSAVISKLQNAYHAHELQYLPSGLLLQENIPLEDKGPELSAQSIYSMAGKLQSYTNIHGQTHDIQCDDFGRVRSLKQYTAQITFSYNNVDRVLETCVQDADGISLTTTLAYDDLGREVQRAV